MQFNLLLWFVCLHAARRAGWYAMPRGYLLPGAQTVQEMTHGCAILFSHWLKARELGTAQVRQPGSQSCLEKPQESVESDFRKLTRVKESEQWKAGPRQDSEVGCLEVGNCWKLGKARIKLRIKRPEELKGLSCLSDTMNVGLDNFRLRCSGFPHKRWQLGQRPLRPSTAVPILSARSWG